MNIAVRTNQRSADFMPENIIRLSPGITGGGKYIFLDLYDMPASAGTGSYIDYSVPEAVKVESTPQTRRADYMLRVCGDSMEPRFQDGDIVLVETSQEPRQGEIGIFMLNGEAYIKKLGDRCLISLNPKYEPKYFREGDNLDYKGRVIGILPAEDKRRIS